jgi:hypothetical protein
LLITACGSGARQIRGELPLVRFEGLQISDTQARLDVGLRNVNDRTLILRELKARFTIEDQLLLDTSTTLNIDISARGREVIRLRATGQPGGLDLLNERFTTHQAPSTGDAAINAAWRMELVLIDSDGGESELEASGFLHPVPGRSRQFR